MRGDIPLSLKVDLQAVLPSATFTRGAIRRINSALQSGVPETTVSRTVFAAGAQAQVEGRAKIGPIGRTQRVIFDKLAEQAAFAMSRKIRGI